VSARPTSSSRTAERFFFVHLQKTAGTTLGFRLKCEFGIDAVYPAPSDGDMAVAVLSVDHLRERWEARSDEIRVITGHFPVSTVELLDAPFTTLTLLREPIERALAALRDQQHRSPQLRGSSLETIYDDPIRAPLFRNHMVMMLSVTPEEAPDGSLSHVDLTRSHLEVAQRRLSEMGVVGFQDRFDAFCADLVDRFGWDLGEPIVMNRTQPAEIPDDLRARVIRDNALDIELYEFARARFRQ
jgi:hypothetical protein